MGSRGHYDLSRSCRCGCKYQACRNLYNHMPVLATTLAMRGLECSSRAGLIVKESAEEGAMFLNSAAADDFATQRPAEALLPAIFS